MNLKEAVQILESNGYTIKTYKHFEEVEINLEELDTEEFFEFISDKHNEISEELTDYFKAFNFWDENPKLDKALDKVDRYDHDCRYKSVGAWNRDGVLVIYWVSQECELYKNACEALLDLKNEYKHCVVKTRSRDYYKQDTIVLW